MGNLYDRLKRLERGGTWFSSEPSQSEWGVSQEIIAQEWERVFGPLPALVAREARRIKKQRERGEPLDDVVGSATGTDLMALVASYGSFDAVPDPVVEALEASERRAGERGMGERDADLMRRFHRITIMDAFEILNAEGDEE